MSEGEAASPKRHTNDAPTSQAPSRVAEVAEGATESQAVASSSALKMRAIDLTVRYGEKVGVKDVSIDVHDKEVLALIGPSGCGKSTFLRSLNRMNDSVPGVSVTGQVELDGEAIYGTDVDPVLVRRRVGMVFQRSNPFPKSIFENVAYGLRIAGVRERSGRRRAGRARAPSRRPVGRGEGPAPRVGTWPLGRPAAAALHRARPRRRAGGAADGRAGERARSDRDGEGRGSRLRAARRPDDRHRHAQHAAGRARVAADGLLLHGPARRGGGHHHHLHAAQSSARPRITSREDSAEACCQRSQTW